MMEENLAQKSIELALCCKWKEAIKVNLEILKNDSSDVEALNRLAKAYFENGEIKKALTTSKKALQVDPNNNIARNSLEKFKKSKPSNNKTKTVDKASFIEVPGKTKITTLVNLGSEKTYSCLSAGDEVYIVTHAHKVSVTTTDNKYIGKLTDDLSARMRILIKSGKKYQIYIKSISQSQVRVFIKGESFSFPLGVSEPLSEFNA